MAASETVRLQLQFDYPPPATPHCTVFWLLVDLNRCRVVTDLISLIRQRFGFSSGALLGLYLEGGLLPPAESARLVRDNDCLRVKLEDRETPENLVLVSNGDDSYFTPRKAKKRAFRVVEDEELELGYKCFKKRWKKQESNSHNENALDLETKPVSDQPGRKKSKRKSKVTDNTADEEEESKKKSPKRKEKCEHRKQSRNPKSPKAQKEWIPQNCSLPKGAPRSNLAKARRKGRASAGPKGGPNSVPESESSGESSSNGQGSVTVKGGNAADKLSAELLKDGLATKTTAPSKPMFTFSPSKGKATRASSSSDSSSDSDKQCVVSKNTSPSAADLLKTAGLFAGRGCPGPGLLLQTPGTIGWKPSDSSKGRQDPGLPGVSVPTNLGRGWGRGEDFLSWRGPRGRGIRGKGRGRGYAISCILNRNLECQKEQQLNEIITNSSTIIQNPVEIHKKDYSLLPLLAAAPQVGEKIAFKLLELTSDYSPDVSDYKEGKILSHNPETQQVDIEILSSLPALKEPGKFDLVYHNENGTEVVEYAVTQERRLRGYRVVVPAAAPARPVRSLRNVMAELFPLAEELSCSICLEPFKEPVTTPCGHNFCRSCLDETWVIQDAPFRCPQCRAMYPALPQLHKNTVLCAVVEQFLQAEQARATDDYWTLPVRTGAEGPDTQVPCDHCLKEVAVKTCLVCMASFCQEHLQPHLDRPAFQDHPLQPPVRDLLRRKCPQHNRLRDFFCPEHSECICHICLVEHKTCSPTPLSQASTDLENKLRNKLADMYSHINGATKALEDVRARQQNTQESTNRKMEQLRQEYKEMKALIDAAEASSTQKMKEEEERVSSKFDTIYQVLLKRKSEMNNLKAEIELSLTKGDEFEFLEKAAKLQGISIKPVYIPKVELDHELIKGIYQGTLDLKNELRRSIRQLQEKKPEEPLFSGDAGNSSTESTSKPHPTKTPAQEKKTEKTGGAKGNTPLPNTATLNAKVLENFLAKSRPELLEYSVKVILDYNTAHNKVSLTNNYTTASVADVPQQYQSHPQRFTYCSQVLGLHCYKKGIHYWEVALQKNHFCGVGICYGSMERQGPESRLGRNSNSWCVEWFNNKISAWHNNVEKTLPPTKATRVGVLLNCDHGFVIFFAVSDKVHVMYKFKVAFTEALYPAFWVFSAGATVSICSSK